MLRLDFINVGDGDAILIREYLGPEAVFTMLVDCGLADIPPRTGSRRQTAASYLREQGVARVDLLVISHLHPDHFAGMARLDGIKIDRLLSVFLPADGPMKGQPDPAFSSSVQGLYRSLGSFIREADKLKKQGCALLTAVGGERALSPNLQMRTILADSQLMARQKAVLSAMQEGATLPESILYPVSKQRNNASLRLSLHYAGRRILLPGDAYGAYWENEADAIPYDILKLPHHGDASSLTLSLIRKLRPAFAVVSGLMGDEAKHRPAACTIDLLQKYAGHFILLENNADCGVDSSSIKAAVFFIDDDGSILYEAVR